MGVRALGLVLLVVVASPAVAGTGAHFTLGLGAEYLSTEQGQNGTSWKESTLQPVVFLSFDGNAVDPRFLTFYGQILAAGFRLEQTDADATTKKQLDYGLGVRLFSNRPVSVEASARRSDSNVTGPETSGLVGGVDQTYRAVLDVRPTGWPQFRLSWTSQQFAADDPTALRDQKFTVTELTGNYARGLLAADLVLRRDTNDFYNGLIGQQIDLGMITAELNRGGRDSFLTRNQVNRYTSTSGGDASPAATSFISQNRFRHLIGERGSVDAFYNHQTSDSGTGNSLSFDQPGASMVLPVTRDLQVEAAASYLESDLAADRQLRQPVASLGLRWGRSAGAWSFSLNPRANWVSVSGRNVASESSWGGAGYGAIRVTLTRFAAGLEGEYTGNQLFIGVLDPSLPVGGGTYLTGLDRSRWFGRASLFLQPFRLVLVSATAELNRRIRLTREGDVAEESRRAQVDLTVATFKLVGTINQVEISGGEIPSSTRIETANLYFAPAYWLLVDGLVQSEKRSALGVSGTYKYAEAGVRLKYAKLSFYARVRQEETGGDGTKDYTNRRVWAGVGRTFDFRVGQVGR